MLTTIQQVTFTLDM